MDENCPLTDSERDLIRDLGGWLPERLFDSHVHCWPARTTAGRTNDAARTPGHTFNHFPWEDHLRIFDTLFPEKAYRAAVFGHPGLPECCADNGYILDRAREDSRLVPIFLAPDPVDQKPALLGTAIRSGFRGVKAYPRYAQKKSRTEVAAVWTTDLFQFADRHALPLIMHLPNGFAGNAVELCDIAVRYPSAPLIAAHMGVTYCHDPDFADRLRLLAPYPNIFVDTAMVTDATVIAEAIAILSPARVLFASDAPFSFLRGGYARMEGRIRLLVRDRYSWVDPGAYERYRHQTDRFRLIHLEIIGAIKEGLRLAGHGQDHDARAAIFHRNAETLFS